MSISLFQRWHWCRFTFCVQSWYRQLPIHSKLSFHKHGVVFLQKNLKSINPTSKNQVFDCFSAQEDFHMRLSQLLGEWKLLKNPRISLYSYVYMYLYVYLYEYVFVYVSICLSVCLSVCLSACLITDTNLSWRHHYSVSYCQTRHTYTHRCTWIYIDTYTHT